MLVRYAPVPARGGASEGERMTVRTARKIVDPIDDGIGSPAEVSGTDYRDAMSRIAGAVHIVTTDGPAGLGGATMTAVASVSDAPPTVLICLNRTGRLAAILHENGVFCVNTLVAGDETLAGVFAGVGGLDHRQRFDHGAWGRASTGAPVLEEARAAFDCRVTTTTDVGSHTVIFATVEAVRVGAMRPALLYLDRAYRVLPPSDTA